MKNIKINSINSYLLCINSCLSRKGFTLVELIVSITISILLMTGVGVFVSSGIKNITLQEKFIDGTKNFRDFSKNINNIFQKINRNFSPILFSSGILLKQYQDLDKGGFVYIGQKTLSGEYCKIDPSVLEINSNTNHIFVKSFIPYEEIGEDMFVSYNDILSKSVTIGSDIYRSDVQNNTVYKDNNVLVGRGVFGNDYIEAGSGNLTYLNSPTGLAVGSGYLFISDTLNNKILAFDYTNNKVYKLLDEKDGLFEPTGLYYDNSRKSLFISNSGKGEILEYSSSSTSRNLDISFNITKAINSFKKMEINFYNSISNITYPNSTGNFSFTGLNKNVGADYFTGSLNTIVYYFSNFLTNFQNLTNQVCSSNYTSYYESNGDVIKEIVNNCSSGTGTINSYKGDSFQNISSGTLIKISTLNPVTGSSFSSNSNYYLKLKLVGSGITDTYEKYFPFIINGDNDLLTRNDNTLRVVSSNFSYPTGITMSGVYIEVNDFVQRKKITIDVNGNELLSSNLSIMDFSSMVIDNYRDFKLNLPISKLDINYQANLLTLVLSYYKQYNCYNPDEKIERTFIIKKNFQ